MGSDMNQLMTGQAAAVTGWLTNTNALKILGEDRVDMMLWTPASQLYANVYYTTDDMLAKPQGTCWCASSPDRPRMGSCPREPRMPPSTTWSLSTGT